MPYYTTSTTQYQVQVGTVALLDLSNLVRIRIVLSVQKNISLHCTTSILVPVLLLQLLVLQYSTTTSVLPTIIVEVGPTRFNVGNLLNTGSTAWHTS